jgi:hypothetical protein
MRMDVVVFMFTVSFDKTIPVWLKKKAKLKVTFLLPLVTGFMFKQRAHFTSNILVAHKGAAIFTRIERHS